MYYLHTLNLNQHWTKISENYTGLIEQTTKGLNVYETADLLRKHGGKTSAELKVEGIKFFEKEPSCYISLA